MTEKAKHPEIRFVGFSDPWEQRKYSDTFINIPNNTLSRADLNYNFGLSKNIHYGDVLIKFGELLNVEKDEIPFITNRTLVDKFRLSKMQNGDVIIADTAEDETVGKCTELINVGEEIIVSGLHTIPSRPILPFASGFLGYFMNSSAYHTQLLRLMQGSKVSSISKSALRDTIIFYPSDILEQKKISAYFYELNELITLQQYKIEKLEIVKKSMLMRLFPKEGADTPEIRLRGFDVPWEPLKFCELFIERSERAETENEDKLLSCAIDGMFLNSELFGHFRGSTTIGYLKIRKFDLILSMQNLHLGNANVNLRFESGIISPAYKVYSLNKCDPYFIQAWLKKNATKSFFMSASTEGASQCRKNIEWDILENQYIRVPSFEEQKKIGEYFTNIDNLITLHQNKLGKLKNIKKSMLKKMFVSGD